MSSPKKTRKKATKNDALERIADALEEMAAGNRATHALWVKRERLEEERLAEIREQERHARAKQDELLAEDRRRFEESKKNEREMLQKFGKLTKDAGGGEKWKGESEEEGEESSEEKTPHKPPSNESQEFDGQDYG